MTRYNNISIQRGLDLDDIEGIKRVMLALERIVLDEPFKSLSKERAAELRLSSAQQAWVNRILKVCERTFREYILLPRAMRRFVKAKDGDEAAVIQAIAELESLTEEDVLVNPECHIDAYEVAWCKFLAFPCEMVQGELDACIKFQKALREDEVPTGQSKRACHFLPPTVSPGLTTKGEVWQSKVQEVEESRWMRVEAEEPTGVQPPYKFLANLDIEDASSIRRIMEYLHFKFAGHRSEQFRAGTDLDETEWRESQRIWWECDNNALLKTIVQWFAGHYQATDRRVGFAARRFQSYATHTARNPQKYKEEYEAEKIQWEAKQETSVELTNDLDSPPLHQQGSRSNKRPGESYEELFTNDDITTANVPVDMAPSSSPVPGDSNLAIRTKNPKPTSGYKRTYQEMETEAETEAEAEAETEIDEVSSDSYTPPAKHNVFLQTLLPKEGRTTRSGRPYNPYTGDVVDAPPSTPNSTLLNPSYTQLKRGHKKQKRGRTH
ncbi:uncharacterized protein BP5553_08238 [Venustampulla echinocandica]|uniref:Uncharacterized protein n=1 Tax=Venustampulla echinocandica TaxID=2656787 RepID=A0A370TG51_9HELO|nr:uncharacterized protein BP5553_08238 [Venustampulla echinocandica]RDL33870.1 hypothetical protein BP5553_08238 [Venustampulla echinocandica]